jgi:hypothetical protein
LPLDKVENQGRKDGLALDWAADDLVDAMSHGHYAVAGTGVSLSYAPSISPA